MNARDRLIGRLERSRPGYRLVQLIDAALEVSVLQTEVLATERREIGPVEEFSLKAISLGLVSVSEIGGLLGLRHDVVLDGLADLIRGEYIVELVNRGHSEVRLTKLGEELLEGRLKAAPSREDLTLGFDRLSWSLSDAYRGSLLRPNEVRKQDRLCLPVVSDRRLTTSDIDVATVEARFLRGDPRYNKLSVNAIAKIVRQEQWFRAVEVAIFVSQANNDAQVAVIDEEFQESESHSIELERLGGLESLGISIDSNNSDLAYDVATDYGSDTARELLAEVPSQQERSTTRNDLLLQADSDLGRDTKRFGTGDRSLPVATSEIEAIDTPEHRTHLEAALTSTEQRLLIISPWIAAAVVNSGFLERLNQLIHRGVTVHIGYGINQRPGDRQVSDADRNAEASLRRMSDRHDNFTLVRLGNTHSKQLIYDDVHICGSFNWLSFQGSSHRTYRHEESLVVRRKRNVDQQYNRLLARLDAASGPSED